MKIWFARTKGYFIQGEGCRLVADYNTFEWYGSKDLALEYAELWMQRHPKEEWKCVCSEDDCAEYSSCRENYLMQVKVFCKDESHGLSKLESLRDDVARRPENSETVAQTQDN